MVRGLLKRRQRLRSYASGFVVRFVRSAGVRCAQRGRDVRTAIGLETSLRVHVIS